MERNNDQQIENGGLMTPKRTLLHWAIFISFVMFICVISNKAMDYAGPYLQTVIIVSIGIIAVLYLYNIQVTNQHELEFAILSLLAMAFICFRGALLLYSLHVYLLVALAIGAIIGLFAYLLWSYIVPEEGKVVTKESDGQSIEGRA